jgi:hypothetical protein
VSSEHISRAVHEELAAASEAVTPRICLVECNRVDAEAYARELGVLIGVPVEWQLLSALRTPVEADIYVVPYYHLDDAAQRLIGARVVGIHVAPDPGALLDLLQSLQAGREVGLICGSPGSVDRFAKLLQFYTSRTVRIASYRDRRATTAILRASARVFATSQALAALRPTARSARVTPFPERIDGNALGPLRLLLRDPEIGRPRAGGPIRARRGSASGRGTLSPAAASSR